MVAPRVGAVFVDGEAWQQHRLSVRTDPGSNRPISYSARTRSGAYLDLKFAPQIDHECPKTFFCSNP
jgi:hypothetical protein